MLFQKFGRLLGGRESGIERGQSSKLHVEVRKEANFSSMQRKTFLEVRRTKRGVLHIIPCSPFLDGWRGVAFHQ